MKFYRIQYGNWGEKFDPLDVQVEWATNIRDAARIARENDDGDYKSKVTCVDVPTDKGGLLFFLNENIWR